jgi:hypothetical protein
MSRETSQFEKTVEVWARARLQALAAEAAEVASEFYLRAARERAERPREEWGRLGVRVRAVRAERAAPVPSSSSGSSGAGSTGPGAGRGPSRGICGAVKATAMPARPWAASPNPGSLRLPTRWRSALPRSAAARAASRGCGWPSASMRSSNAHWLRPLRSPAVCLAAPQEPQPRACSRHRSSGAQIVEDHGPASPRP